MIFWHESSATKPGGTTRDGRAHEPGAANIPAMPVAGSAPLVSVPQAGGGRRRGSCDYGADRSALSGRPYYGSRRMAACLNQAAIPPGRLMRQCRRMVSNADQERTMVLKIERFQPEGMNIRMSGGKPSYSHVLTVSGSGKIVYTAGQLARDVDGNCVGKGDMRAQMEQTFQNLDRCLKAAGATWADVVKTNTFVTDFDEFQKCADIRMRYLGVATPTSTTVGVTRLAGPDFMIEIEAVAVVNS